jgi:achaete-scute complex protein
VLVTDWKLILICFVDLDMHHQDNYICTELIPVKISSPTCEDLGIPKETDEVCFPIFASRIIKNPSLHIDGIRYEATLKGYPQKVDPYSPVCMIPLPLPFGTDHVEPTFVRRRNERERDRVKCVNEGYTVLKEHLPIERKNKRVSKVEILRFAIDYIRHLEDILKDPSVEESEVKVEQTVEKTTDDTENQLKRKKLLNVQSVKRKCVRNA